MKQQYDIVVIGAGSGGLTSAVGFSKIGKSVLLVEKEHMGGECTNSGCVPSKALLHAAKEGMDGRQAMRYVRSTIDHILEEETPDVFAKMGIDVVMGEAEFVAKCAIRVGEITYEFKHAVISTGSSPRMATFEGLDEKYILTNQNLFQLEEPPKKLLIIGGGPIGLEMAQAFAMLGTKVTIAERSEQFARLEDPAIRPILRKKFEDLGIDIQTGASVSRVTGTTAHIDHMHGDQKTSDCTVEFDNVLIAIGRVPNLPPGLAAAGIMHDDHCIHVDKHYRTSNKYVYAVGDVSQRMKFTHTADDIARQVVARVASRGLLGVKTNKSIPKVTYTTPEVAQVGMSWKEAVAKYDEDRLLRIEVPFDKSDRAKTDDATDGILIVIARRISGQILGAHIIGPRAGELLAIFSLAIDHKISMWKLQKHVFAYPTYSLIAKKAGDVFVGTQLGNLKGDLLASLKRNAPKIIAGLFWVALLYTFTNYRISNDLSYQDVLFQLLDFIQGTAWGPILYILLYAIRPLILFPATLMTALSGAVFGPFYGIIYTVIGENASANLAYWVGRFFGKGWKLEDSIIGNWVHALRENTFGAVLFMRLAYFPFDLTNYASGVVQAKWRQYFLATIIGIMPGLTVFVLFGASFRNNLAELQEKGFNFESVDTNILGISIAIFVASLVLSKVLKRWKHEA